MGKGLIALLSCWLYAGVVSAQGGAGDEQVWRLIKEDLERTQSVYITDSSIYCRCCRTWRTRVGSSWRTGVRRI